MPRRTLWEKGRPRRTYRAAAWAAGLALALGLAAVSALEIGREAEARRAAQEAARQIAGRVKQHLTQNLAVTQTLAAMVRQGQGAIADFENVAGDLMAAYPGISALQLAPRGVIRQSVPLAGNEKAIGHDLFADSERNKEARLAAESGDLTLAGPLSLRQGGEAVIGRLPVYFPGQGGERGFWGFTIAVIRIPDFLNALDIDCLEELGYAFQLGREAIDDGRLQVFASSATPLQYAPERVAIEVPNGRWYLDIAPLAGWYSPMRMALEAGAALLLAALAGGIAWRLAGSLQAVAESDEKYRLLAATAREGIWQIDAGSRTTYVNDAMAQLLGYERREMLIGLPLEAFVFPEDLADPGRQLPGRERGVYERRLKRRDGSACWCLISSSPLEDCRGMYDGVIALVTDFNERKRTEEALRELNRDFVALLESTSDFIYFKDHESRFRFCSQTLAHITGHRHWRDLIGKHDLEVFPPDMASIYFEEELPIFRDGVPLLDKIDPYYDEKGKRGWISTNKWPVFGEDGKTVVGIFGISRIVTERVRTEAELLAANQELQGFTYAASHDLKAPLHRINSFSALLEKHYRHRLDGDGTMFLDLIRRNATRMTVLIEDLLAHAQIEQQILTLQPIDLAAAVQGVLAERADDIREGGVQVRLALAPVTVRANPHGLAQVLRNLLENAIKYSAGAQPPAIEIGGEMAAGRCRFWVRDNGIGFDMAYHERIFEIFRRLHTYEEYPGSGIGLALVRKAMQRMGGRVWAESAPGQGATFFLELEAEVCQAAPPVEAPSAALASG